MDKDKQMQRKIMLFANKKPYEKQRAGKLQAL
jgi:hypothetical protein